MPMKTRSAFVQCEVNTAEIRTAKLFGSEHIVVPVVALIEGVLHPSNAPGPELALASEFAHQPAGWNGRPVVLNHPKVNGQATSANEPRVLQNEQFGMMFNTFLDGNKLKSEMWLNIDRANELGGMAADAVDRLKNNEVMEVSTGLFMDLEESTGTYNGQEYTGIWRNIVPDHLAILPPGTIGACSVADGCGAPRANQGATMTEPTTPKTPTVADAGLPTVTGPTKPTPTCNTGSTPCMMMGDNHCASVGCLMGGYTAVPMPQQNVNPSGQKDIGIYARIAAAIGSVMRGADKSSCGCTEDKPGPLAVLLGSKLGAKLNIRDSKGRAGLSDVDARAAIQAAMRQKDMSGYVVAMYDDFLVYEDYMSGDTYQVSYSISPNGTVSISEDSVQVRPVTEFIPVKANEKEKDAMAATKAKVDGLIANSTGKFTESDRPWLTAMSDEQIDKFVGMGVEVAKAEVTAAQEKAKKDAEAAAAATTSKAPATLDDFIKTAPPEVAAVLAEGVRLQKARKDDLVKAIKANGANKWSDEQLGGFDLSMLENIASISGVRDFSGQRGGAVQPATTRENERFAPPPPALFPVEGGKAA